MKPWRFWLSYKVCLYPIQNFPRILGVIQEAFQYILRKSNFFLPLAIGSSDRNAPNQMTALSSQTLSKKLSNHVSNS